MSMFGLNLIKLNFLKFDIKKLSKECRLGKCVSPHETLRILEDEIKGAEITGKKNELLLQLLQVFSLFHF